MSNPMNDTIDRKKFPRLLMAHPDECFQKINGAHFVWARGGRSQILDMSYAGIVISAAGVLDKVKLTEYLEAHILLPTSDQLHVPVSVRVVKKTANIIGFRIDSVSPEGRIKIEQGLKDSIVAEGMRSLNPQFLQSALRCTEWYHGPFDTNLFIWKDADSSISKMIIEYDNSVLVYQNSKFSVARTSSSSDESAGYGAPFLTKDFGQQKLSLGQGWAERFNRVMGASCLKGTKVENFILDYFKSIKPSED